VIAAIIVAAGRSTRMGISKPLLPHVDSRTTFAYMMNRMGEGTVGDNRSGNLMLAFYSALG